jgi:hypothetical protein
VEVIPQSCVRMMLDLLLANSTPSSHASLFPPLRPHRGRREAKVLTAMQCLVRLLVSYAESSKISTTDDVEISPPTLSLSNVQRKHVLTAERGK